MHRATVLEIKRCLDVGRLVRATHHVCHTSKVLSLTLRHELVFHLCSCKSLYTCMCSISAHICLCTSILLPTIRIPTLRSWTFKCPFLLKCRTIADASHDSHAGGRMFSLYSSSQTRALLLSLVHFPPPAPISRPRLTRGLRHLACPRH